MRNPRQRAWWLQRQPEQHLSAPGKQMKTGPWLLFFPKVPTVLSLGQEDFLRSNCLQGALIPFQLAWPLRATPSSVPEGNQPPSGVLQGPGGLRPCLQLQTNSCLRTSLASAYQTNISHLLISASSTSQGFFTHQMKRFFFLCGKSPGFTAY